MREMNVLIHCKQRKIWGYCKGSAYSILADM